MSITRTNCLFSVVKRFCHFKKDFKCNGLDFKALKYKSKVPATPIESSDKFKSSNEEIEIKISEGEIKLLERLSLVDLDSR